MTEQQYYRTVIKLQNRLERIFRKQQDAILKKTYAKAVSLVENGMPRFAEGAADTYAQEQRTLLERLYTETADVFGRLSESTLESKSINRKTKLSPTFWNAIEGWAKTQAALKIVRISATTRELIRNIVSGGLDAGIPNAAIAKDIRAAAGVSRARAALIARTEVHNAAGKAAEAMARTFPYPKEKKWLKASDERTRAWHRDMSDEWIPETQAFMVDGESMMYPGDSAGSGRNVCNCRCGVMYRRKKETLLAA